MASTNHKEPSEAAASADPKREIIKWYISELGSFISAYSLVEWALNMVLWTYAKIDKSMATAIFSSSRVDFCCQTLKRIIDSQSLSGPDVTELLLIIEHLGIITRVRNDILHYGVHSVNVDSGNVVISNMFFAHLE